MKMIRRLSKPITLSATIVVGALLSLGIAHLLSGQTTRNISFGEAHGTAAFVPRDPAKEMVDAPDMVLSFMNSSKQRVLVLTNNNGDYRVPLEPGRYCIEVFSRTGEPVELYERQIKCIDVTNQKDVRLDVALLRP